MSNSELIIRDDNTQKVFLSESSFDVMDILNKHYDYILEEIQNEGIILKGQTCNLFKEWFHTLQIYTKKLEFSCRNCLKFVDEKIYGDILRHIFCSKRECSRDYITDERRKYG